MAYFLDYLKSQRVTTHKRSSAILEMYGMELATSIKKGYKYDYLMGSIFVGRKDVLSTKPVLLKGKTKRLREETGDMTLKVYRTNDYYYSIFWTLGVVYRKLELRFAWIHNRTMKNYEEYLELSAPALELERNRIRTSQYQLKK